MGTKNNFFRAVSKMSGERRVMRKAPGGNGTRYSLLRLKCSD